MILIKSPPPFRSPSAVAPLHKPAAALHFPHSSQKVPKALAPTLAQMVLRFLPPDGNPARLEVDLAVAFREALRRSQLEGSWRRAHFQMAYRRNRDGPGGRGHFRTSA